TGAAAEIAEHRTLHFDGAGGAVYRLRQLDGDLGAQVLPGHGTGIRARSRRPHEVTEDVAEDVAEIDGESPEVETAGRGRPPRLPAPPRRRLLRIPADLGGVPAHLVVKGALFLVGEDLEGEADLLELLLRFLVAGVDVRVVPAGESPVRLLDLLGRGGAGNSQKCVQILSLGHVRSNVTSPSAPSIAARGASAYHGSRDAHRPPSSTSSPRAGGGGRAGPPRPGGGGLLADAGWNAGGDHVFGPGAGDAHRPGRARRAGGGGWRVVARGAGSGPRVAAFRASGDAGGGASRPGPGGRCRGESRGGGVRFALRFRGGIPSLLAATRDRAPRRLPRRQAAAGGGALPRLAHPPGWLRFRGRGPGRLRAAPGGARRHGLGG